MAKMDWEGANISDRAANSRADFFEESQGFGFDRYSANKTYHTPQHYQRLARQRKRGFLLVEDAQDYARFRYGKNYSEFARIELKNHGSSKRYFVIDKLQEQSSRKNSVAQDNNHQKHKSKKTQNQSYRDRLLTEVRLRVSQEKKKAQENAKNQKSHSN